MYELELEFMTNLLRASGCSASGCSASGCSASGCSASGCSASKPKQMYLEKLNAFLSTGQMNKYLLWQIYYDFYYILTPAFGPEIMEPKLALVGIAEASAAAEASIAAAKAADTIIYREIVEALVQLPCASPWLFTLQKIYPKTLKVLYLTKGALPSWLEPFPAPFHNLLRAVKKGHHFNVCYYLQKLFRAGEKGEQVVAVLCAYYGVPFISLPFTRNDLQYVLAVYARLHTGTGTGTAGAGAEEAMAEIMTYLPAESPLTLRAKLIARLTADPILTEMEKRDDVTLAEIGAYITARLSPEELNLYTGVPEAGEAAAGKASAGEAEEGGEGEAEEGEAAPFIISTLELAGRDWIQAMILNE